MPTPKKKTSSAAKAKEVKPKDLKAKKSLKGGGVGDIPPVYDVKMAKR